jgi:uncharacterized phage-associated protein
MADVQDVAAYILERSGAMSAMKLQKLVYYSQAWHLVWEDEPLFQDRIEAWANGPVVYAIFEGHRGSYRVDPPWRRGDSSHLTSNEKSTIDAVIQEYEPLTGRQLSFLTHSEDPWRDARHGLSPTARSNSEITLESMGRFYSALDTSEDAVAIDEIDWNEIDQRPDL